MGEKITETYVRLLISENLKRLRSLQKVSQLDLATNAGLTPNFINDIENKKKWTSARTIAKLCTALKVEPFQFFVSKDMTDDKTKLYIDDVNNTLHLVIKEVTDRYKQTNSS